MSLTKLIVGGASISEGPWPTWVDLFCERYSVRKFNTSKKGLGNEAIITTALHKAWEQRSEPGNTLIVVMLTTIDKWDWYIDNPALLEKFSKEKHTITPVSSASPAGFWGTGSWFPLEKELYRDNFYSQDYFVMRTLQMIGLFKQVCETNNWNYEILFDCPIWSNTEQELNLGKSVDCWSNKLINTDLNRWLYDSLKISAYEPGLIGFLAENKMPWFSTRYGWHPGTRAHYEFSKQVLYPKFDHLLPSIHNDAWLQSYVDRMDKLWTA